jgi:MFS family permease
MALARRTSARAIARRHNSRHRRGLGDASCSNSPRVLRGGIGALIGGVLGGMIGGGLAVAVSTLNADITAPVETVTRFKHWALIGSGVAIVGAIGGLAIGAAKPEC